MCFDVIPLSRQEGSGSRTRNERSNNANKLYHADGIKAAGKATGQNIRDQIRSFREHGYRTAVILIIQGNTYKDMITFYKQIAKQLSDQDWEYVGGIAVADTCIGNGEAESIEMIRAYQHISEMMPPWVAKHLHVLGVGSIKRMAPFVYLKRSGYLDKVERISYDSSSHTSTFTYGLLKVDGGCKPIGVHREAKSLAHFRNLYDMYGDYLGKHKVSKDDFIDIIFGKESHAFGNTQIWSHSDIKQRAMASGNYTDITVAHLMKGFHTGFQIANFMSNLDKLWDDKYVRDSREPMKSLLKVKDDNQLEEWQNLHSYNGTIKSRRIKNKDDIMTLESFYGN
jgi:RNAse (barnase) inhibitor barstar